MCLVRADSKCAVPPESRTNEPQHVISNNVAFCKGRLTTCAALSLETPNDVRSVA